MSDDSNDPPFFDTFIGKNPFAPETAYHVAWTKANRLAAEELNVRNLLAAQDFPGTGDATLLVDWLVARYVERFDMVAKYMKLFVVTGKGYAGAERYRHVLEMLDQAAPDEIGSSMNELREGLREDMDASASATFVEALRELLMPRFRMRWAERRTYWMGQALSDAREHDSGAIDASQPVVPARGPSQAINQDAPSPMVPSQLSADDQEDSRRDDRHARRTAVESLLERCNQELGVERRLRKTDFWKACGYKNARSFQYWQAGDDTSAGASAVNAFDTALRDGPTKLVNVLRTKRLL